MSTQTDVSASVPLSATGQFTNQAAAELKRTRVKAIYAVPGVAAGTVVLRDGGSDGPIRFTLNTVASVANPTYLLLPGEGILFTVDVHGTLTGVGFVTVIYG